MDYSKLKKEELIAELELRDSETSSNNVEMEIGKSFIETLNKDMYTTINIDVSDDNDFQTVTSVLQIARVGCVVRCITNNRNGEISTSLTFVPNCYLTMDNNNNYVLKNIK